MFCEDDAGRTNLPPNVARSANLKAREKHDELHNEVGSRDTHGFGDVGSYVCDSTGQFAKGCSIGSVSSNGWSVGDLCFAFREIEISSVHINGAQRFCSLILCTK
jgi:hypothetical protein